MTDRSALHERRCEVCRYLVTPRVHGEGELGHNVLCADLIEARVALREVEQELAENEAMDRTDREYDRVLAASDHKATDALMLEYLGVEKFNYLWGPELERLGQAVDAIIGKERLRLREVEQERDEALKRQVVCDNGPLHDTITKQHEENARLRSDLSRLAEAARAVDKWADLRFSDVPISLDDLRDVLRSLSVEPAPKCPTCGRIERHGRIAEGAADRFTTLDSTCRDPWHTRATVEPAPSEEGKK